MGKQRTMPAARNELAVGLQIIVERPRKRETDMGAPINIAVCAAPLAYNKAGEVPGPHFLA